MYRTSGGDSCTLEMENVSMNNDAYDLTNNQRIAIYGGIVCCTIFFVFSRTILSFLICLAAARHLHNNMFKAILRSPVFFFDTNPVGMFLRHNNKNSFTWEHFQLLGRVLNRFSKDIGFMDDILPFQFLELFTVSYIVTI